MIKKTGEKKTLIKIFFFAILHFMNKNTINITEQVRNITEYDSQDTHNTLHDEWVVQ